VERRRFGFCNDSAQNVCFSFGQPDFVLNLAVCEHRLRHTANVPVSGESTYLNLDRHRDLVVEEHSRRYIQVYADIDKLEVDNRRSSRSNERGLKASGRDRDLRSNSNLSELAIRRAHARVLDQPRVPTRRQELGGYRRNGKRKVSAASRQVSQGKCISCGRRACCSGPGADGRTLWRQD